jgi:uncharacterized protein YjcR
MVPITRKTPAHRQQIFRPDDERARNIMRSVEQDDRWLSRGVQRLAATLLHRLKSIFRKAT